MKQWEYRISSHNKHHMVMKQWEYRISSHNKPYVEEEGHSANEYAITTKPHVVKAWYNADEALLVEVRLSTIY